MESENDRFPTDVYALSSANVIDGFVVNAPVLDCVTSIENDAEANNTSPCCMSAPIVFANVMDGEKVAMPVLEKVLSIANVIDSPNVWSDEEENPSVRP